MSSTNRRTFIGVLMLPLILSAGCSPRYEIAEVDGVVTYGGVPVGKLFIMFMPEKGPTSTAETDEQGRFKLQYRDPKKNVLVDGAIVGKHRVIVTDVGVGQAAQGEAQKPGRIPPIFGDMTQSPITKEIGKGKQTIEIKLD